MAQIFESPDGGKTVYSRQPHSLDRTIVKEDLSMASLVSTIEKWMAIVHAAETNPTLKNILDQAEMTYAIIKKEEK